MTMVDIETSILEQLDFEFAPPCETRIHEDFGYTGPAEWVVDVICECGDSPRYLMCSECLVTFQSAMLECAACHRIDPGTECVRIISRV